MTLRVNCIIPGCRRGTTKLEDPEADEIICGPHFRMIPAATRRRRRLIAAEMRRQEKLIPSDHDLSEANLRIVVRTLRMRARSWRLCVRQAMHAAAGI